MWFGLNGKSEGKGKGKEKKKKKRRGARYGIQDCIGDAEETNDLSFPKDL